MMQSTNKQLLAGLAFLVLILGSRLFVQAQSESAKYHHARINAATVTPASRAGRGEQASNSTLDGFVIGPNVVGIYGAPAVAESAKANCDESLWRHVYKPERLKVIQKCVAMTGTIVDATAGKRRDGLRHEADGDTHGWLKPDPGFETLLLPGNKRSEGGNLVFEAVCQFPVKQQDAVEACRGYRSMVVIPPVGSHVRIVGTLVQDQNHDKWAEIHPVSSIEVIQ